MGPGARPHGGRTARPLAAHPDDRRPDDRRRARGEASPTSSTAAHRGDAKRLKIAVEPGGRDASACPSDGAARSGMSTATPVPETVGADRRRRPGDAAAPRAPAPPAATRSCGCATPTASATPGRSPSSVGLVLVQAIIALVGLASAFGDSRRLPRHRQRDPERRARAGRSSCSPSAVDQAHEAGPSQPVPRPGRSASSARSSRAPPRMGQLERGLNRIYGIEQDRPTAPEVRPGLRCWR